MGTYVLVHGSWFGAWAWDRVVPLLKEHGHTAIALDLPGHGSDRTPLREITLQRYVDRVLAVLDDQPEPAILVGHSHGGVVITQAAEERPDKIATLAYVCAYLPGNGESLLYWAQQDPDPTNNLLSTLIINEDEGSARIREDHFAQALMADCSDEDVAWARSRVIQDEPLASPATPVKTTEGRFGRIPRVYIECLHDQAISPALQKRMYTAVACHQVISMGTSHSPFVAAPEELAAHLAALAAPSAP